ncbi:MAG: SdrD B-like domain-containing protein [Acidobacteriota bacterium]
MRSSTLLSLAFACSLPLLSPVPCSAGDETTISGRVWEDEDRNGIDDDGTSVAGVTVVLQTPAGVAVESTTTGALGEYSFTTLASGPHVLRIFPPAGFLLTFPDAGPDFEDSDFDRTTGSVELELIGGSIDDMDAGVDERDDLDFPAGTVNFGEVATTGGGAGVRLPVELANLGESAAEVDDLRLTETDTWSWSFGTCSSPPFVLAAGGSCQLELTATPASTSLFTLVVRGGTSWNLSSSTLGRAQVQGVRIRFVDAEATTGANNGSSWMDAYNSLADALAVLDPNEKLWLRSGIYPAAGGPFSASTRVRLAGGFAGTESGLIERNLEVNAPTVLSGDIGGDDVDPDGDGLIASPADIRGQNAERILEATQGLELDGVVVSAADGALDGAAIMATGVMTLEGVLIVGNRGASAVWKDGSGGRILDTGFENNIGTALVFSSPSNAFVTSSRFIGNRSDSLGGAIRALDATSTEGGFSLQLRSVLAVGNSAAAGGAIYFDAEEIATRGGCLTGRGDEARGGGGCEEVSGRLGISRSTFAGNSATGDGGALWLDLADLQNPLAESIFWRNSDASGTATSSAVVHYDDAFQALFESSDVEASGGSGSWNAAFGIDGGGNLDLDPLFVNDVSSPLSLAEGADYRLWASSPVLDLGSTTPDETTDAAGNARVEGPAADLGALEGAVAGIYGRVWRDVNGDGTQDADEPGWANVAVAIASPITLQTSTDGNGNFRFADLPAGTYSVSLVLPDGFEASPRDQGDDAIDSDFDQFSIDVPVSNDSTDIDSGLVFTGLFVDDFESGNTSAWALQSP